MADVTKEANKLSAPPVVIGHSMGGLVIQKYLENHQAPAGILLASVLPAGVGAATLRMAIRHPLEFFRAIKTFSLHPPIHTPYLARQAFSRQQCRKI